MKRAGVSDQDYEMVRVRDLFHCVRCRAPTMEGAWHHRRGKAVVDLHTDHSCNGIWLCHECHRWVHASGFRARAMGWIVSRISYLLPHQVPVLTAQYGWVLLDCEGSYESCDAPPGSCDAPPE